MNIICTQTDTNAKRGFVVTGGFNTGRQYTQFGQRIFWAARPDGWVYFIDIDRCISGWMHRETPGDHAAPVLPSWLVQRYDRNAYTLTHTDNPDTIVARVPDLFDFGTPGRF